MSSEDQPPPMPRWVKLLGLVVLALVGIFIATHVAGLAPSHGP